jgi:hypothetical protein
VELAAIVGIALGAGACLSGVEESMTLSADGGESSSTAAETTSVASTSEDDASASAATDESGSPPSTTSGGPTGEETSGADDSGTSDAPVETTGEPSACDELDEEECDAAKGVCMSIVASPFIPTTGSNYCIGDDEFVGCIDLADCKAGTFVQCDFGHEAWLLKTSCGPEGWMPCDEPGNGHASDCR